MGLLLGGGGGHLEHITFSSFHGSDDILQVRNGNEVARGIDFDTPVLKAWAVFH